jgi:hypothetical protein
MWHDFQFDFSFYKNLFRGIKKDERGEALSLRKSGKLETEEAKEKDGLIGGNNRVYKF